MKMLILGCRGQLGSALQQPAMALGEVTALDRTTVDLADLDALRATLERIQPDIVLNAAAYTAVDRAEQERDLAFQVNAHAPALIAQFCAQHKALLVHYSTDYVFDGRKADPYVETDATGPLNVYGASKLAGEHAILNSGAAAVVLRTTWVYGDEGGNFAKTMLRLACERDQLRVVADQWGTPTWAGRLAELSCQIMQQALATDDPHGWLHKRRGVYHASAGGQTHWADYARLVVQTAGEHSNFATRLKVRPEAIEGIPAAAYPTPAARPSNSMLDTSRLAQTFGYVMPEWSGDVTAFVRRFSAAQTHDENRTRPA